MNAVEVCMLQFVDDTLFLVELKPNNIFALKNILKCFELGYELKVNFNKTKIGGIGVSVDLLFRFARMLNCNVMNLPCTYLGMPIGGNTKKTQNLVSYYWEN